MGQSNGNNILISNPVSFLETMSQIDKKSFKPKVCWIPFTLRFRHKMSDSSVTSTTLQSGSSAQKHCASNHELIQGNLLIMHLQPVVHRRINGLGFSGINFFDFISD